MLDADPIIEYVRNGRRSEAAIRLDIFAGKCTPVYDGTQKLISVQYDGKRFDRHADAFYTPEAFVALFLLSHAMSCERAMP